MESQMSPTLDTQKLAIAVAEKRGKMSRSDAAEVSGIPENTLARMERQHGTPTLSTYAHVCDWLGRSMDDFFERAPQPA
jgi:transcriptional regulator with XRE-family HTH domain